ncbi:hypothetical protein LTR94_036797, partial [Friedmanniomyces endolithicus]
MAVEQIMGAGMERTVEFAEIDRVEQVAMIGVGGEARDHMLRRHHQFQQRRESGDAIFHEIQMVADIVQAEAEPGLVRAIS